MVITLVAFLFVACASSSDDDAATVNAKDTSIPSSMTCNASADSLQGTWATGCYAKNDEYRSKTILVSGDCFVQLTTEHEAADTTCVTPTMYYKRLFSGLVIGDAATDSDGNSVTKIDGVWEHKLVTPMNDFITAQVNDNCSTTINSGETISALGMACNTGFNDGVVRAKDVHVQYHWQ
jgi:hypothetical protein